MINFLGRLSILEFSLLYIVGDLPFFLITTGMLIKCVYKRKGKQLPSTAVTDQQLPIIAPGKTLPCSNNFAHNLATASLPLNHH